MSPVAINGVDKQGVYVNGVQVKQALNAANETVNKGVYDPTTLSAVDADLAAGNIKDTVNIFGKVGTVVEGALAEDVEGSEVSTAATTIALTGQQSGSHGAEVVLASKTLTFEADSLAFAAGFTNSNLTTTIYLRLYMGGVLMGSVVGTSGTHSLNYVVRDFKALSGEQTCEVRVDPEAGTFRFAGRTSASHYPGAIAVGSVKLV